MFFLVNKLFSYLLIVVIFLENCCVYRDVRYNVSYLKCMDIKLKKNKIIRVSRLVRIRRRRKMFKF